MTTPRAFITTKSRTARRWQKLLLAVLCCPGTFALAQADKADSTKVDYTGFQDPAPEFRGTRWFTFNMGGMTDDNMKSVIEQATQNKAYGGWMATPSGGGGGGGGARRGRGGATAPAVTPPPAPVAAPAASYLNDEFFRTYKIAIEEGLKKGFPLRVLYDEQQFPTGMAGGLFVKKYPDLIGKSLEKAEKDVAGPANVELPIPIQNGTYIGTVRMNMDTLECVDITAGDAPAASYSVPAGNWKVMAFYLDPNSNRRGLVDYLDPDAVDGLIDVMYQRYYDNLKEYFGKVIKMTFYDEPGMQHPEFRGRLWTKRFNADFQKKYGYSPMKLYPALYYDIGADTAAARNALFGFRAEMYSKNFIGRIAAWDEAHGVKMAGHLDQEEAMNPVSVQGDLMKVFQYQQVPGHDDIWYSGRSTCSYKIVTSSAFNWDKPVCVAETFAAYRANQGQTTPKIAYRTVMDQHAMGINYQVGNYVGNVGVEFGEYVGRLQYLLQHGKHVADVGVVYPIAAMQSAFRFAVPPRVSSRNADANFYYALEGGIIPPEIDYMTLGEMLFRGYKVDYTYLHPDIISDKSLVQDGKLILDNKENREEFRVLILPGGDTINLAVAKKIQEFYNAGGAVIATSMLPTKAAEMGKDKEVQQIMDAVFGLPQREPITADIRSNTDEFKIWWSHPNQAGGQAYFIPRLDTTMMTDALAQCDPVRDVDIQLPVTWPVKMLTDYDGAVTYIHKLKDGKDIYFFANSTDAAVTSKVVLRGEKKLAIWDPHTGEKHSVTGTVGATKNQPTTTIDLSLDALKSVFYVTE